jgi:hypothetical protein
MNVERFRKMLLLESDEAKRKMLAQLLAEEEAKLSEQAPPSPPKDWAL